MNVGAFLTRNAMKHPDKVCLIEGGSKRKVTYREFNIRVNMLAHGLQKLGFKKGNKAGLYLRNRLEWPEIYYALSKLEIIVVPINFNMKSDELLHVIKDSGLSLIFIDEGLQENIEPLLSQIKRVKNYVFSGMTG